MGQAPRESNHIKELEKQLKLAKIEIEFWRHRTILAETQLKEEKRGSSR